MYHCILWVYWNENWRWIMCVPFHSKCFPLFQVILSAIQNGQNLSVTHWAWMDIYCVLKLQIIKCPLSWDHYFHHNRLLLHPSCSSFWLTIWNMTVVCRISFGCSFPSFICNCPSRVVSFIWCLKKLASVFSEIFVLMEKLKRLSENVGFYNVMPWLGRESGTFQIFQRC